VKGEKYWGPGVLRMQSGVLKLLYTAMKIWERAKLRAGAIAWMSEKDGGKKRGLETCGQEPAGGVKALDKFVQKTGEK